MELQCGRSDIKAVGEDADGVWMEMYWPNAFGTSPADVMARDIEVSSNGETASYCVAGYEGDRLYLHDNSKPINIFK